MRLPGLRLQDGGSSIQKESTLNKCSTQDFNESYFRSLLDISYSGTDMHGYQELRQFNMVQIMNNCTHVT